MLRILWKHNLTLNHSLFWIQHPIYSKNADLCGSSSIMGCVCVCLYCVCIRMRLCVCVCFVYMLKISACRCVLVDICLCVLEKRRKYMREEEEMRFCMSACTVHAWDDRLWFEILFDSAYYMLRFLPFFLLEWIFSLAVIVLTHLHLRPFFSFCVVSVLQRHRLLK